MNFIRALLSGRPFKRPGDTQYYKNWKVEIKGEGGVEKSIGPADLDANDWETEPKRSVVDSNQVKAAVQAAASMVTMSTQQVNQITKVISDGLGVSE